ncbi:hypothetical protein MUK42_25730 [Musa troglodytarum]|uniref:Uncharacterized protein n=1 Tax=Musa troglodytarum TaxID=320322 RepID=A0A9E7L942_9LILI|nr:hypothetical protein MUK42_25730 [Musa troglodytarum]
MPSNSEAGDRQASEGRAEHQARLLTRPPSGARRRGESYRRRARTCESDPVSDSSARRPTYAAQELVSKWRKATGGMQRCRRRAWNSGGEGQGMIERLQIYRMCRDGRPSNHVDTLSQSPGPRPTASPNAMLAALPCSFGRGDEETVQRHDSTPLNYKSPCSHDSSPLTDSTMELPVSANKPEHHDLPHQPASPSQFAGSRINVFAIIGFVFLTINFLDSAFRSRHDPSALAFAVFVYSDLALLFVCLRNFEKLGADCSPAKKERVKATVWALASALNLALAWRVAEIMPPMLAVVVWLMAGLVTLGGFYGLFLYRDADDIVAAHDYSPTMADSTRIHIAGDSRPSRESCHILVALSFLFLTVNAADAACRSLSDPAMVGLVLFSYVDVVCLFCCLARLEKLGPDTPPAERRKLKAGIWVLATALSLAFAWRVAEMMPWALAVALWGMSLSVALAGFYGLILYEQQTHGYYA